MTPEDTNKIIAAIDRNTEAIRKFSSSMGNVSVWLFLLWMGICVVGCPRAKATPLLPPLDQPVIIEIGTPPAPPPNPHVQYWHTQYVPGPQGVLPVEVFAPRLVAQVASDAAAVDVPEPGTWWLVGLAVVSLIAGGWIWAALEEHKCKVHLELLNQKMHEALWYIAANGDEDSRAVATKALEEKP